MSKEKKRLGRGLESLLSRMPGRVDPPTANREPHGGTSEKPAEATASPQPAPTPVNQPQPPRVSAQAEPLPESAPTRLDIRQIQSNPAQPRQDFDPAEMQSLTESLGAHGLLQPVVVRRHDDRYQLIAGERRLRAAQQAGWTNVPVNVVKADDRQTVELAIVENLQRKDLNPLEKAASFQRYLEQYGCTQDELATRLKLDRSTIANLIRLLELPEPVRDAIRQGKITQGHARALLPLGDQREQIDFCRRIQREGLNVRQTETLVQQQIDAADAEPLAVIDREGRQSRRRRVQSEHVAALEQEFRSALGTKVKITHNARGRGKLVIHFRNHEEFERLRRQLTAPGSANTQIRAG